MSDTPDELGLNQRDDFDNFLRRQLSRSNAYIQDDGFTANVMAGLATRRPKTLAWWQRYAILLLPALCAGIGVAGYTSIIDLAFSGWLWFSTLSFAQLLQLIFGVLVGGVCLLAYCLERQFAAW